MGADPSAPAHEIESAATIRLEGGSGGTVSGSVKVEGPQVVVNQLSCEGDTVFQGFTTLGSFNDDLLTPGSYAGDNNILKV